MIDFIVSCLKVGEQRKFIPSTGYYVYIITEDGQPCYIGKGKRNRVLSHFERNCDSLVSYKIRENRMAFDWAILETFENEADAHSFEKEIIIALKNSKVKLYNTVYYTKSRYNLRLLIRCLLMNDKHEKMFYRSDSVVGARNMAMLMLQLIKDISKDCLQENLPLYKFKRIENLGYAIIPSINGYEQYILS